MADDSDIDFKSYGDLLEKLLAQIKRLPAPVRRRIQAKLDELIRLVRDHRCPRFMLVGRRGAGKSMLLNAMVGSRVAEVGAVGAQTGEATWHRYTSSDARAIEVLDTRGVQEGSRPAERDDAPTAEASVLGAVELTPPDALLFLCKAKEVDSAIHHDVDFCGKTLQSVRRHHGVNLPVVAVVTQCDELDPPFITRLPTEDAEKTANVTAAVEMLRRHLVDALGRDHVARVIPTVAYARFRADGSIDSDNDFRWNIEELKAVLIDELPQEARLEFARLVRVRKFQRDFALKIVHSFSSVCSAIGAEPIPLADLPFITSLQVLMVVSVAYVAGRDLSLQAAQEFLVAVGANVGAAFLLREAARGLIKLVPGASLVSGLVAGAGTEAIGRIAVAYFIDKRSIEEAKRSAVAKPGDT